MSMCYGHCRELKPCEHIKNCDLIINVTFAEYDREVYMVGIGQPSTKCKRDCKNCKVMTKQMFLQIYHKMPVAERKSIGLLETYMRCKLDGLVE